MQWARKSRAMGALQARGQAFSPNSANGVRSSAGPPSQMATKVVGALLSRGLIAERVAESMAKADPALNRIWRNEPDGRGVLLYITPAGLDAIGIEPAAGPSTGAEEAPVEPAPKETDGGRKAAPAGADTAAPRKSRDGTKQAQLIEMLKRHLMTAYGMTPEEYRARWALKADYPMVAPSYAKTRQELAKKIGLGRKPRIVEPDPAPKAKAKRSRGKAAA